MTSGLYFPGCKLVRTGLSDKLQIMTLSVRDELVKVEWLIDLAQIIVKKSFVRVFNRSLKLCPDRCNVTSPDLLWILPET